MLFRSQIPLSVNDLDQPCCCVKCAAELRAILPDVERLVEAASALLAKRAATEMTYEEAYYFVFKNYGREYWSNLCEALALIDQPVAPKETK